MTYMKVTVKYFYVFWLYIAYWHVETFTFVYEGMSESMFQLICFSSENDLTYERYTVMALALK